MTTISNDTLGVRITADPSDLKAGTSAAADAVKRATERMRDDMGKLGEKAKDAQKGVGSAFQGIAGEIKGLVAAYAGIESIKAMAKMADDAALARARIQSVTGSTEAATMAQQQLYAMSQRLQTSYQESLSSFARIMPAVKELGGGVKEATRLSEILVVTAKMSGASSAEASASAMQFAQALGSGTLQGDELRSILEGNQLLARKLADALGVSIGELRKMGSEGKLTSEVVANALLNSYDQISAAAGELPQTVGGAWTQVQNAFLKCVEATESKTGVFAFIARALSELAKVIEIVAARFNATKDATDKLGASSGAAQFAQAVGYAFSYALDLGGAVIGVFVSLGKLIGGVAASVVAVLNGDFAGAAEIIKDAGMQYKDAWDAAGKAIAGQGGGLQAYAALQGSEGDYSNEGRSRGGSGGGTAPLKGKGGGKGEGTKGVAEGLQAELDMTRAYMAQRNAVASEGLVMQAADEAAYWELALKRTDLTAKDRLTIQRKAAEANLRMLQEGFDAEMAGFKAQEAEARSNAEARLAIVEKEAEQIAGWYGRNSKEYAAAERRRVEATRDVEDQIKAIRQQSQAVIMAQSQASIDAAQNEARSRFELGVISKQQLLQLEQQFEQQRAALRMQAAQAELAAVSPDKDPVKYAQITAQIEQLEIEHQGRMRQIRAEMSAAGAEGNPMMGMTDGVVDAVGTMVDGVIGKFQNLRDATTNILKQLYATFVNEMITKPLQQMMLRYLRETVLHQLMGESQTSLQRQSSTEIMSTKASEALSVVSANAAEAGSGAAASVASTPYVGPFLAAAAFASVLAMVLGAGRSIRSARNGFDIPAGLNPVTQLHEREMVLPEKQADAVRDMAEGGGRGDMPVLSGVSAGEFFIAARDDLVKVLKSARRDFAF